MKCYLLILIEGVCISGSWSSLNLFVFIYSLHQVQTFNQLRGVCVCPPACFISFKLLWYICVKFAVGGLHYKSLDEFHLGSYEFIRTCHIIVYKLICMSLVQESVSMNINCKSYGFLCQPKYFILTGIRKFPGQWKNVL